jgi:rhodanese-related sulfurtransferase
VEATVDVGAWLHDLGLDQYEAAFRENEIDVEVLPDLTDADLEKLGVVMGHRKRLLKAIAGLSGADWQVTPTQRTDEAERRQLTVMFCDLVGSTAMSAQLDPDDMRGIITAYHKCCAGLIERNGGFVAKYMGDGVLVYFGYPQAHEHDAEHAGCAPGLRLSRRRRKVVICHHGARSQMVVDFLRSAGFDNAVDLDGGIDAWACDVDPSMRRYR